MAFSKSLKIMLLHECWSVSVRVWCWCILAFVSQRGGTHPSGCIPFLCGGIGSAQPGWPHSVCWSWCYQVPYSEIPSVCSPSTTVMPIRGTALPQELIPVRDHGRKSPMLFSLPLFQSCHRTEQHITKTKGFLHNKNEKYPNLSKCKSQAPINLSRPRISSTFFRYSVFIHTKPKYNLEK